MPADNTVEAGREAIHQGAAFDQPYMLRNLAATVLASAGLLGNSATTIIGAMLVASLTGPVMGIGLALVDADNRLLRRSLFTLLGGAVLVLATGASIGRVAPDIAPTDEMLMLTSPRLLDLVVALVGGAISAYAVASPRLSSAIVGIAIAVTLVPPLATAAILGSQDHWALARGAFLMAFVNMVAIQVGASTSLWLCGYRSSAQRASASLGAVLRREKLSLLVMLGLVATLAVHGVRLIDEQRYEASVRNVLAAAIAQRPEARLVAVLFSTGEGGRASVTAVVRSPARFTFAEVSAMGRSLPAGHQLPATTGSYAEVRILAIDLAAALAFAAEGAKCHVDEARITPMTRAAEQPPGHTDDALPHEWIAFERMLADLAAQSANVAADKVEQAIERSMTRLLDFLGFDRCSYMAVDADNGRMQVVCSVAATSFTPLPRGPFEWTMPWLLGELRAGRSLRLSSLPDALPIAAVEERRFAQAQGLRAQLSVPLRESDRLVGFLTLAAFHDARAWPDPLVARLSTVGHVFAQALARSRTESELVRALAEIRLLKERLEVENTYLRSAVQRPLQQALASRSPLFQRVLDEIAQVAPTQSTVLLLGETGTGKELLAEAIHEASPRRTRAMVKINCAALPPALIEAELFGREKGAYTGALARQPGRFEVADGSTLFLDEIGEMPVELQTKLLRVLQDGRFERVGGTQTIAVDVRLVAATNRNLLREVEAGRFREDLYYRLNVFPIEVPALRERPEDVPLLAWTFVKEFAATFGKPTERISDDSMAALVGHDWPGNVRELRNVVERAMILSQGPTLHIALTARPARALLKSPRGAKPVTLEDAEREHVRQALERSSWRVRGAGGAAELLGLKPTTLESLMKRLALERPRSDSDGA